MEAIPEVPRSMPIFTVKRAISGTPGIGIIRPGESPLRDHLTRSGELLPRSFARLVPKLSPHKINSKH